MTTVFIYSQVADYDAFVAMIEAHYGTLLDTAYSSLLDRLDAALVAG